MLERNQLDPVAACEEGLRRAVGGCVVEDEDLALQSGGAGALDRLEAAEQVLAPVRVHDAVGERGRHARHDNRLR